MRIEAYPPETWCSEAILNLVDQDLLVVLRVPANRALWRRWPLRLKLVPVFALVKRDPMLLLSQDQRDLVVVGALCYAQAVYVSYFLPALAGIMGPEYLPIVEFLYQGDAGIIKVHEIHQFILEGCGFDDGIFCGGRGC